jgi:hypothetical protein
MLKKSEEVFPREYQVQKEQVRGEEVRSPSYHLSHTYYLGMGGQYVYKWGKGSAQYSRHKIPSLFSPPVIHN